ncbi:mediator of RNA polymerase II transcription subunit 15a-like isoform X2 [Momordica charantia]|nr:mediator of RNA polymerase II transcription subunit 15a-like isoform X2 [Momordica charantia]
MVPGLPENGRADCEEDAWDDFLFSQRGKVSHQIVNDAVQEEKPFIISTPGMSPSALLEEVSESDRDNDICSVTPLQRLLKMVNVMSPKALSASISDIDSIVCMTDRVASSAPLNKSKAEISEDLVGTVTSRLRKRCSIFGGSTGSRRTRHCRNTRMYTSSRRMMYCESYDLNSTFTERSRIETPEHSHWRGFSLPFKQYLLEEIRKINEQLIDTVVSVCDKDMITTDNAATNDRSEGIIVECSFAAMRISSNKISQQASALQLTVHPLKLLVPKGYPHCSPIFNKLKLEA